jgi:hypothetical protein
MEIKIPKIVQPLELGEYAPELAGQVIQVWVNPPPAVRKEYFEVSDQIAALSTEIGKLDPEDGRLAKLNAEAETLILELDANIASMWSQGAPETHFSAEEVGEFRRNSFETDQRLLSWMVGRSLRMMLEHQGALKKNSTPPAGS